LQLAREDVFLPLPAILQPQLAERHHARIVEIVRKPLQQIVDAMPGDPRRMQRERDHGLDPGLLEADGLDADQLVPVPAQVERAAGKGTRMRSERAKVLHQMAGRPMAFFPIRAALALDASPVVVVVGYQAESVTEELGRQFAGAPIRFALQAEQLGTGHAVLCAQEALRGFEGSVLILAADVPLLRTQTLQRLVDARRGLDLALL